jgi:hypothetical protein
MSIGQEVTEIQPFAVSGSDQIAGFLYIQIKQSTRQVGYEMEALYPRFRTHSLTSKSVEN